MNMSTTAPGEPLLLPGGTALLTINCSPTSPRRCGQAIFYSPTGSLWEIDEAITMSLPEAAKGFVLVTDQDLADCRLCRANCRLGGTIFFVGRNRTNRFG
jgi:hypothetical protein